MRRWTDPVPVRVVAGDPTQVREAADGRTHGVRAGAAIREGRRLTRTPHREGPGTEVPGPSLCTAGRQRLCCESATVTSTRWNSLSSL